MMDPAVSDDGETEPAEVEDPDAGWLARDIGRQLREVREERGYGLRETARRAKTISKAMLGQVEKDGQNVALDKLEGVLRALNLRAKLEPVEPVEAQPLPDPGSPARRGVIDRFARVVPFVPEEELEVFIHQLSLWEKRHKPADGV